MKTLLLILFAAIGVLVLYPLISSLVVLFRSFEYQHFEFEYLIMTLMYLGIAACAGFGFLKVIKSDI